MQFRDYLRHRKLAFALKEVRDSETPLLDIAFNYGFSSHEAFTRAFKATYGVYPQRLPKTAKTRGATHQSQPVRPLLFWARRDWHDRIHTGYQNLFCYDTRA